MFTLRRQGFLKTLASFVAGMAMLAGCATNPAHEEGVRLLKEGRLEQAIPRLEEAVQQEPRNARARADLLMAREALANRLLSAAANEQLAGRFDAAQAWYEKAAAIEPSSERAHAGLEALRRDRRHAEVVKAARAAFDKDDFEGAAARLQPVLAENPANRGARELKAVIDERRLREAMAAPQLESAFRKPVSLEFRDTAIKLVFDALSRATGIHYILDKDVRADLRTTVSVRQTPLEDALDLILMTNQLAKKVLSPNTILVYPATAQKLKEYQDLVVKGFYLTSADVKQAQAMLKTLIKVRDIFIDEKLNLLIIRDTPEAVRLAEKLIALHDLGEREVMLELEVLEVRRSRLLDLGIQFPDQLVLKPIPSSGDTVTLSDLRNLNSTRVGAKLSDMIINLKQQDGDVNLLANPRVRAKNREKARILIGERVPVVTSTATTAFVTQNIQYLDVGLKLEIEPEIHLDGEVGIKVTLEVSSITREIITSQGLLTYQLGTRTAATALRLRDGETQILAGLINDEDRRNANRVPGLGDLPVVGRLFSSVRDDNQKTEIVLSITPRLVRGVARPEAFASQFWSGTETALRTKPLALGLPVAKEAPIVVSAAATAAPRVAGATPITAATAGQAVLALRTPGAVKVGETFKLDLLVKSDGTLRSLPFQLGFDPAALEVVEVAEGQFFKQGGETTNFAANVDRANGRIFVGVGRTGAGGAKGEESLVTVTFRARAQKPKAEIRVLAATPVAAGQAAVNIVLPPPQALSVTP